MKYTKDLLESAVAQANSFAHVCRILGVSSSTGMQTHITKRIRDFNIDTSHFLGQYQGLRTAQNRQTWEQVLICRQPNSRRNAASRLRRALKESGVVEVCALCGQEPFHNSKPLRLQVDHINGLYWDDRRENVRFLCPNCHSQTETFGVKNKRG
jgi:hypothetical protein